MNIRTPESEKSEYRARCKIRNCARLAESGKRYCSEKCGAFPCARLKQLDARYREKYGMSMLDNLQALDAVEASQFVLEEEAKWACRECGAMLCVHKPVCVSCGSPRG